MTPPITPVKEAIQAPDLPAIIELFDLDISAIAAGQPTLRFVSGTAVQNVVQRGGVSYMPAPLQLEGFDRGGTGAMPQPTVSVGDILSQIGPWVYAGQDLLGAELTRTLVLRENLDDGSDPDPAATLGVPSVYRVVQKVEQTAEFITFRLSAAIDTGDEKFPRRQVLRDSCLRRYRVWDSSASAFDYSKATCPYNGANMFNVTDQTVTVQSEDQCGRKISGCRLRFPGAALPITAFPGVGKRQ